MEKVDPAKKLPIVKCPTVGALDMRAMTTSDDCHAWANKLARQLDTKRCYLKDAPVYSYAEATEKPLQPLTSMQYPDVLEEFEVAGGWVIGGTFYDLSHQAVSFNDSRLDLLYRQYASLHLWSQLERVARVMRKDTDPQEMDYKEMVVWTWLRKYLKPKASLPKPMNWKEYVAVYQHHTIYPKWRKQRKQLYQEKGCLALFNNLSVTPQFVDGLGYAPMSHLKPEEDTGRIVDARYWNQVVEPALKRFYSCGTYGETEGQRQQRHNFPPLHLALGEPEQMQLIEVLVHSAIWTFLFGAIISTNKWEVPHCATPNERDK